MRPRVMAVSLVLLLLGCQSTNSHNPPIVAQSANLVCAGYGAQTGSITFSRCVAYQESRNPGQSAPPYRLDHNNRVDAEDYVVDSRGRRMPVQSPYYFPWDQASSVQPILRDEYVDRYDARGNRI